MSKDAMPAGDDPQDQVPAPSNPVEDIMHVLPPGFSQEEVEFIYNTEILGLPARVAAKRANMVLSKIIAPHIVQARDTVRRAFQQTMVITRADIVHGYQEAIHMAKLQGDALTAIVGWEKTAKILGLEQPTKLDINITSSVEVLQKSVKAMSDEDLMKQLNAADIIDAEFYEVGKANGQG